MHKPNGFKVGGTPGRWEALKQALVEKERQGDGGPGSGPTGEGGKGEGQSFKKPSKGAYYNKGPAPNYGAKSDETQSRYKQYLKDNPGKHMYLFEFDDMEREKGPYKGK
jgi:hypothetical protein